MVDNVSATNTVINLVTSGAAKINDPGKTVSAVRRDFGSQPPNTLDLTSYLSPPASIPGVSSWTSELLPSVGGKHIGVGFSLSQGGSVVATQYLDSLGYLANGATTLTVTASQACVLDVTSTTLFNSFSVTVKNTATAAATLSRFTALIGQS